MLFKKFQSVITAIDQKNHPLARELLSKISESSLSIAGENLLVALRTRVAGNAMDEADSNTTNVPTTLSEHDTLGVDSGISIVSCCMDRNDNLLKALPTWIKLPVDEIVIVDWSSQTRVTDTINDLDDDRIKVLRVEGESKWILTYAFNVGLKFARFSKVIKLDADIELSDDFFELNSFDSRSFIRGNWKSAIDGGLNSQVYINGTFGAHKHHLQGVGYYNEFIRSYGWDDSDLYERLSTQCGLGAHYLDLDSLHHMEQREGDRLLNQSITSSKFLGSVLPEEFNNQRNKFIGRTSELWGALQPQDYTIEETSPSRFRLNRITESAHIPDFVIEQANSFTAFLFFRSLHLDLFYKTKLTRDLAWFLYSEYENNINYQTTQVLLGHSKADHTLILNTSEKAFVDLLKESLIVAEQTGRAVYVITRSETYQHKYLGDECRLVEVVGLPLAMLEAVQEQRLVSRVQPFEAQNVLTVDHREYTRSFEMVFRPKLYVDVQHGLGNRLRAIGSAAAVAEQCKRELVIVWQPDLHCECEFVDLFRYEGPVINASFLDQAERSMTTFNYMEIESGGQKGQAITIDEDKHLYLRSAYAFSHPASNWESENIFLRGLIPSGEVEALLRGYDVSDAVGVHVRMEAGAGLDQNAYDSVENWTNEDHKELHYWRSKSHYSHFVERIDDLLVECPSRGVFLATDLPETYSELSQYYGEKLSYLARSDYDRSRSQVIYALADALLLSRTALLLGSNWSSFTELARRLSPSELPTELSGIDF